LHTCVRWLSTLRSHFDPSSNDRWLQLTWLAGLTDYRPTCDGMAYWLLSCPMRHRCSRVSLTALTVRSIYSNQFTVHSLINSPIDVGTVRNTACTPAGVRIPTFSSS